ncbi:DUF2577 domain-containing protein [Brevibacillus panacihumi]|uniref:DUF2577 domain-containing protein n=1 Tax=Brevibacillus panacihumi TaxID=497735 RepID=UPI003D0112B2
MRLEGSGFSQLRQVIAKYGRNDFDKFELATVLAPPPELRIKIDNMTTELDHTDVIVAEHLTRHKRVVTIEHEELAERDLGDKIAQDGLDTDDMVPGNPITEYTHSYVELTFEDVLKHGDRVIVASMNDGQSYVILDRAVTYLGAESI